MYCIECGAKIPDNPKFCTHCGYKQTNGKALLKEKIAEVIIEREITRQVIDNRKSSINYQFLKKIMGWYMAWLLLHLGLLLIAADSISGKGYIYSLRRGFSYNNNFWPFSKKSIIQNYDIREFLVYTIFPCAILFIWSLIRTQKEDNINTK
jgi:hypothetical protein